MQRISVKIYIEDRSYHSIQIDGSTTVAEVCDQMIQKTLAKHDPAWSIVEHIGKNHLGEWLAWLYSSGKLSRTISVSGWLDFTVVGSSQEPSRWVAGLTLQ